MVKIKNPGIEAIMANIEKKMGTKASDKVLFRYGDSVEFVDVEKLMEDGTPVTDLKEVMGLIPPKEREYQYQMIKDYDDFKYSHLTKKEREADIQPVRTEPKIGRNDPCPCGKTDINGKRLKYKNCCINKIKTK